MNPIEPTTFEGVYLVIAKDQPEYEPLPARIHEGCVTTEWQFTEEERALIARGENLRLHLYTFGRPLQPVRLEITTPEGG